jgi:hypothetical protein
VADEGTLSGSAQTGVRAPARAGVSTWPVDGAQWGWNGVWPDIGFAISTRVRLGRRRDWRRAPVPLDRGRLRQRHRSLLLGRPRARLVGSGVSGRDCCDRGDLPAAPAARALGLFAISAGFAVATIKATLIAHPILRFPAYSVAVGALSSCATKARSPTASCCGSSASKATALSTSRSASGFPSAAAWRRRPAPSSRQRRSLTRRCSRCGREVTISRATFISSASARPASCMAREGRHAAGGGGLATARSDIRRERPRCDRRTHPLRAVRRRRLDRVGLDHRQARRDHAVPLRRHVRLRHRPRSFDLRLSHGSGRRHRVLHSARAAGADPRPHRPHAGQEMGGPRRPDRDCALFGAVRRRGRNATLVYYDRDRSDRRHARPAGADLAAR